MVLASEELVEKPSDTMEALLDFATGWNDETLLGLWVFDVLWLVSLGGSLLS